MAKTTTKTVRTKAVEAQAFYKKYPFHIIIVLFTVFIYSNSLFNDYNMDDELVTRNHRLTSKGISAIPEIFTSPYYQDESGYAYEYRPVPLSTFAIEHSLFGDKPFVSHFINLILYCLLCLCLFRLLLILGGEISPFAGLCIALLFSAHPSHTEVVCSIKNRDEILGLLFCVLSMHSAVVAARKINWWQIVPAAIFFFMAMLCKSTFVPFAFFIPIALILFSPGTFPFITAVTALLSAAVYATLDVNPPHYKMWLIVLLMTGIPIVYLGLRGTRLEGIRSFFKRQPQTEANVNEPYSGLKAWYAGFNITSFYSLIPIAVILFIYQWVCKDSWLTLMLIAILLIITTYLHFRNFRYWNLSLGLLLSLIILGIETIGSQSSSPDFTIQNSMLAPIEKRLIFIELFSILLSIIFYWGVPLIRVPALAFVVLITWYFGDIRQIGDIFGMFVIIMFTRMVIGRYLLIAAFVVFAGSLILSIYTAFHINEIRAIDYNNVWGLVAVALVLIRRNLLVYLIKKINIILAILAITLSLALIVSDYTSQIPVEGIKGAIYSNKDYLNVAEAVVETPTDRPLQYVEFPLAPGTSKDLKIGTAAVVTWHYLVKMIIPYPLSYYYGYAYIKPTSIKAALPVIILILHFMLMLYALFLIRKNRFLSFGLIVYLLSMLIISGYFIPIPGIVADRYLSIPSVAWSIVLTIALFRIWKVNDVSATGDVMRLKLSNLPKGFVYSLTGILCFYSLITFSRNFDWRDDITLFRHDIKFVDKSAQAHNLLAVHLMRHSYTLNDPMAQKEIRNEALGHFRSAIKIYPGFYNVSFDLGRTFSTLNIQDSAIFYFKQAISIDSTNSDAHLIVAKLLAQNNRQQEAIPYFEYRIKNVPGDYETYVSLSYIYYAIKEYEKSIAVNTRAAKQFPLVPDPLINIGTTYMAMHNSDSARTYFQKALTIKPNNPEVMKLLGQLDNKP